MFPTQLAVTSAPFTASGVVYGGLRFFPTVVEIKDAEFNSVPINDGRYVTAEIETDSGATLQGTTRLRFGDTATDGVATFNDLTIRQICVSCRLRFTSGSFQAALARAPHSAAPLPRRALTAPRHAGPLSPVRRGAVAARGGRDRSDATRRDRVVGALSQPDDPCPRLRRSGAPPPRALPRRALTRGAAQATRSRTSTLPTSQKLTALASCAAGRCRRFSVSARSPRAATSQVRSPPPGRTARRVRFAHRRGTILAPKALGRKRRSGGLSQQHFRSAGPAWAGRVAERRRAAQCSTRSSSTRRQLTPSTSPRPSPRGSSCGRSTTGCP